jgi:hypothetical protein
MKLKTTSMSFNNIINTAGKGSRLLIAVPRALFVVSVRAVSESWLVLRCCLLSCLLHGGRMLDNTFSTNGLRLGFAAALAQRGVRARHDNKRRLSNKPFNRSRSIRAPG